ASELAPIYIHDKKELLYASSRKSSGTNETFRFFRSSLSDQQVWSSPSELAVLGEFMREYANIEVADENGKLYLYKDAKRGGVYFSEAKNGGWSLPVAYDSKIKSLNVESHFYINDTEDLIIFASDKTYKTKGMDLYLSHRNPSSGKWSKPVPVSDRINSLDDEGSPFLSKDGRTLYFSSQGHGSIGGFDIYKSVYDSASRSWSDPVNMGYPINTQNDELNFWISREGTSGYLSSDRMGTMGKFDLYVFKEAEMIRMKGKIKDLASDRPDAKNEIEFISSAYPGHKIKAVIDPEGYYVAVLMAEDTYQVNVNQNGAAIYSDQLSVASPAGGATTYFKDFQMTGAKEEPQLASRTVPDQPVEPQVIPMQSRSVPNAVIHSIEGNKSRYNEFEKDYTTIANLGTKYRTAGKAIAHNVYFDFGTSLLKRESETILYEILQFLQRSPSLVVEIAGHTDNMGPESVNEWLSQRRAQSVRNWLLKNGISPDQVKSKGYGSKQPLASNDDETEGRELNRRIEVLIIN
ncbi:MAG: OmpA family protein, partial [Cyclobacteriaceae bacterium]|nr:OmpA family protein [Cyclobacteriaceae bacterium]